jgi:hypothetical protein
MKVVLGREPLDEIGGFEPLPGVDMVVAQDGADGLVDDDQRTLFVTFGEFRLGDRDEFVSDGGCVD